MDTGTVSIILGVLLFGVSTILAFRLVRRKRPKWAYKTTNIIGLGTGAPHELKLTYNGKPVREVYRTTFIIFNKGKEPIRENDITAPITLYLEGGELLNEPAIKRTSNSEVKFSAKKSGNNIIELGFKYLDHNDGAVFEVLHTSVKHIDCEANIIGAKLAYMGEFKDVFPKIINKNIIIGVVLGILSISYLVTISIGEFTIDANIIEASVMITVPSAMILAGILVNIIPQYFRSRRFPDWSREVTKTTIPASQNAKDIVSLYCHKCKTEKTTTINPEPVTLKDGRLALRAICPDCGSKLFRMLAE